MNTAEKIDALRPQRDSQGNVPSASPSTAAVSVCVCDETGATPFDEAVPITATSYRTLDLIELILKNRGRLEHVIREPALQAELMPRLLAIAAGGFTFFGVAIALVLSTCGVWPELTAVRDVLAGDAGSLLVFRPLLANESLISLWLDGSVIKLTIAYAFGLIAATGVGLPSLYFYGLLSCVPLSMVDVTLHALKSKATAAVALIGILPIYAALGMATAIFDAPPLLRNLSLLIGLILPFIAGLWGTRSLYFGFARLAETMPAEFQERRACFLRRLVLSWSACYTAIMPLMIFTVWEYLS